MRVPIPSTTTGDAASRPPARPRVGEALFLPPGEGDAATVPDALAGVGPTFEGFYRGARPSIGRAVALALGDVDLAAEATDEAMVRAFERWHRVSGLDKPEAWVYRVAVNWARSALRRRRRHDPRLHDPRVVEMPGVAEPAVATALAELDVKHRSVVVCRHLLGWSVAETAEALRLREGTVKSRLHRATRTLQDRLAHLDAEEHR